MEINENVMTQVIIMNVSALVDASAQNAAETLKHVGNEFADRIGKFLALPENETTDEQKAEAIYLDHMLGHMGEVLDKLTLIREINDVGYGRVLLDDKELTEAELEEIKVEFEKTPEFKKITDTIERHKRENAAMNSDDPIELLKALIGAGTVTKDEFDRLVNGN